MNEFWSGKRVLVTGHTGFKGSWLCEILLRLGADVTGYALVPLNTPNLYTLCTLSERMTSVYADIRDLASLSDVFVQYEPEVVVHMAAQPLVIDSYASPVYTYETNIIGTVNILECARQNSSVKSVLNVTTDKVYLNTEREEGYHEDEQLCGYDPYANSKSCSELVTYSYKKSFLDKNGIAVSTARSGNVIGGGDFAVNRIIPDCARAAATGKMIEVRNPFSVRPYQHVLDTLFAYLLVLEKQQQDISLADSYNIGPRDSDCAASGNLATLFCKEWAENSGWSDVSQPNTLHEDKFLRLNCDKIASTLGWTPVWDIGKAVAETVKWYKAFYLNGEYIKIMQQQIEEFLH